MNWLKAKWAWVGAIAGLIIYDVIMASNGIPGDTLSEFVWTITDHRLTFFLGFALGVVVGHLFWQKKEAK